ncbi:argonaute-like protein [Infundibulicybe gibba]|nr:argonaute-like protein [Infundibulicybe gibba]
MPPRAAPTSTRGTPRGGGTPRGEIHEVAERAQVERAPQVVESPVVGRVAGMPPISQVSHVRTVGVQRPDFGTAGQAIDITVNVYPITVPNQSFITMMLVRFIDPETMPARFNAMLIRRLQESIAPDVFTPRAVYDNRKNLFATRRLPLGDTDTAVFNVDIPRAGGGTSTRPPKLYKVRLTKVAQINPEVLSRFIAGQNSQDNEVLTALTALNVVIRMDPTSKFPFNVRSFFTPDGRRAVGGGIELWRGYFQSVRPTMDRLVVNVDISTGMMFKPGPLIDLCLEVLGRPGGPNLLQGRSIPDRERLRLQRFLAGVRITTPHTPGAARVLKKITAEGANTLTFEMRDVGTITVADYFRTQVNRPLRFPNLVCAEVGSGALIPLELCVVPEGQIMRRQVPPEIAPKMLEFSTMKPPQRFESIKQGLEVLAYGQSEYIRQFGMSVDTASGPLQVKARVLNPPTLKYGPGSKQLTITPRDGAWNMVDKRFFKPADIRFWVISIYETERRFGQHVQDLINGFLDGCRSVGIRVQDPNPIVKFENGQGRIGDQLRNAGMECARAKGAPPTLIVVVLPDGGNDIYTAVKHFGDCTMGVATQCLKSSKCSRAKMQYWANVMLKVNVKLGGINTIPDQASAAVLTDPNNPTMVMGADVIHPAPGSEGRPSFTALVGNVDSDTAKYIAATRVQEGRQEMIEDLEEMSTNLLKSYIGYRQNVEKKAGGPKRIIFFRGKRIYFMVLDDIRYLKKNMTLVDGVSEGQFQQVLDQELPRLKAACEAVKIKPKITLVVVGKRHHIRMNPPAARADRSGNCPAGTVIDQGIAHPLEFDYYLQSHGGLLGTSRSAHYSVVYDENGFKADSIQALSFALCHVYARATRSVSIPAPVYYADIVCSRAKNHYDPMGNLNLSDSATQTGSQAGNMLDAFKNAYKPLHANQSKLMYFS